MAPPNPENGFHTSFNGSAVAESSMDSISDSIVDIGDDEIKGGILEALKGKKDQNQGDLDKLNSALNQKNYNDLIEIWNKLDSDAELDDASDLADLIKKRIAEFDEEKLREMCTFSKISYGNVDRKLEKGRYKTKRQFEEEGYQIIKFYDNELIEDKYCLDTDYKLEQHDVGYALTGRNSYARDAGYIFIKDQEVTIAYHGTRDLNDVKEDLRASLTKLSFLPRDNYAHSGFYSLFKRSWPSVHKILQGHANDKGLKIEDLKINVTGHSMGGALASIAALYLNKTEGAEDVHVATFGSPRVFYNDAAEVYNQCLGNRTIRVACQSDPVPCLPHGNAGMHYKHVGKPLKLETDKTLEYLEPHYHKIDTYYNLIQKVKQEKFKSDNGTSKYFYIAYACGLFYNAVLSYADVDDKEFFKEVREENKGIKLSEIPIQYAPKLEEKFKQGEQEVAQLTNDKTQLEKGLAEKIEELKSIQAQLEQEKRSASEKQQKVSQLNDQVDRLTGELKGEKGQLAEKKAELNEQTKKVTELSSTVKELKETNTDLKGKIDNLNNQLAEEKKVLGELKIQSEQNEKEFKKKIEELSSTKQSQASRMVEFIAEIEELRKIKTGLEEKVESSEKSLQSIQVQLKKRERNLNVAKENILQLEKDLQQNLAAKTKEFENEINELQKGLDEKTREAKAQFEQENHHLASQVEELKIKCEQTEAQRVKSKQKLAEEITQLRNESNVVKAQLEEREKITTELSNLVAHLTTQNNQLKKIADISNNNEKLSDKNKNFLEASKKQCIYAAVSFVSSGAFAVGASLTMLHLAICISLAVTALISLAVGCYCSYKANTALNNVEIENSSCKIAA